MLISALLGLIAALFYKMFKKKKKEGQEGP